jgi:hypothetical protein
VNLSISRTAKRVALDFWEQKKILEEKRRSAFMKSTGMQTIGTLLTMPSSSPQTETVRGQKIKKGEFIGVGAAIQAFGLLLLLFGVFLCAAVNPVMGIFCVFCGLLLLLVGGRMAYKLICSNCGNKLTGKEVKICPVCRCHFDG